MSDDDFDLATLANYLHLGVAQVQRLVERGHLPGRRVGGAWRFARAEVHVWMEQQIGVGAETELAHYEGAMRRAGDFDPLQSVAALLPIAAIDVALPARTRNAVITAMVELAERTGLVWDGPRLIEALRQREEMHPTALDNGVALLHPRRPLPKILGGPLLALGLVQAGVPFGGSRGVLSRVFFLILSVDDPQHLHVLARLSRLVSNEALLNELLAQPDARSVHELLTAAELALA